MAKRRYYTHVPAEEITEENTDDTLEMTARIARSYVVGERNDKGDPVYCGRGILGCELMFDFARRESGLEIGVSCDMECNRGALQCALRLAAVMVTRTVRPHPDFRE